MKVAGARNPLREMLAAKGITAEEDVGKTDDWPADWSVPPEALQVDQQVWWFAEYTALMPPEIGHWFYAMSGRVNVELDHAHHPLLAQLSLWVDLPWNERRAVALAPLMEALWLGPFADVIADIRENTWAGIDVLWLDPTPAGMREVLRTAAELGLRCRISISELPGPRTNLKGLW